MIILLIYINVIVVSKINGNEVVSSLLIEWLRILILLKTSGKRIRQILLLYLLIFVHNYLNYLIRIILIEKLILIKLFG